MWTNILLYKKVDITENYNMEKQNLGKSLTDFIAPHIKYYKKH